MTALVTLVMFGAFVFYAYQEIKKVLQQMHTLESLLERERGSK